MKNRENNENNVFVSKFFKLKKIIYRLFFLISVLRYKGYRELMTLKLDKRYPVIDLGANIGQSSIILWYRGFEIYSYEPHPLEFIKLNKLFKDVQNIHTINAAVVEGSYSNEEKRKLYLHKEQNQTKQDFSQGSSLMKDKTNIDNSNYYTINTYKINTIIEKHEKIALVKCDVEGYEYLLYQDLLLNKNKIKYFIIETHASKNPQWKIEDIKLREAFSKHLHQDRYNLNWH